MIRLNLGSGPQPYKGYQSVDFDPRNDPDILHDITTRLPFDDGDVDEIFISHVLEHFPLWQVQELLQDWARVLKVEGMLWGFVPDGPRVAEEYLRAVSEDDKYAKLVYIANFNGGYTNNKYIGLGQTHYAVYDEILLRETLNRGGFNHVVIARQNPGKYDYRLAFVAIKDLYFEGDIRNVGYPEIGAVLNLTPPWEEEG